MDVVIRRFESADAQPTRRVFESAIRGTASSYYTRQQIEAWCPAEYDEGAWAQARGRAWTVVAEVGGEVVGFSDLSDDGELDMLFVDPSVGGRGVARQLVGAVLAQARACGVARVTTRASRAAQPAFERFGFVVDRVEKDNVVRGVVVPRARMHIDLD